MLRYRESEIESVVAYRHHEPQNHFENGRAEILEQLVDSAAQEL